MNILLLNGPNINITGMREPKIYGNITYADICGQAKAYAEKSGCSLTIFQSNCEGAIIDRIQQPDYDAIIINAGAYSHYSYAIRDALSVVAAYKVEAHMTNIYAREAFRHISVLSAVCDGVVCGFGANSYKLAIDACINCGRIYV